MHNQITVGRLRTVLHATYGERTSILFDLSKTVLIEQHRLHSELAFSHELGNVVYVYHDKLVTHIHLQTLSSQVRCERALGIAHLFACSTHRSITVEEQGKEVTIAQA